MPQPVIRPATKADAATLARLRYEFRASQDPAVEPEADFLARCTAWMETRLVPAAPGAAGSRRSRAAPSARSGSIGSRSFRTRSGKSKAMAT